MGELPRAGILNVYTGRNAFSEAKSLAAKDGYIIRHEFGATWEDNSYTLEPENKKQMDLPMAKEDCE